MNDEWQRFLLNEGASIADGLVQHFGAPGDELRSIEGQTVLCDLSHLGLLWARGKDAADFLQGQLTNDIRLVNETRSQLSAYCSPKGRMLASLRVWFREGGYLLQMPREILDPTRQRLGIYILRSEVRFEDASDLLVRVGIAGEGARQALGRVFSSIPAELDGMTTRDDGISLVRIPGAVPRFELLGDPAAMRSAWQALASEALPIGREPWTLLDIRAGLPEVLAENVDAFVPQMANVDLLNGISFRKGCYTGQEIVARTHYLGRLKRRMYRAQVEAPARPCPGDGIYLPGAGTEQSLGRVVAAAPSPVGGYELLAVLQIEGAEQGGLRLGSAQGPLLHLLGLPYPLPEEPTRVGLSREAGGESD